MTILMRMVGGDQKFQQIDAYAEEQAKERIKDK